VETDSRFSPDAAVVEHKRVPFVSYPYEWSFKMLKHAALLHLDILERCLSHDLILKDSSAFNVQFVGSKPIFIDILSFARLEPGELWIGYNQFCKMFLYPLMLQAYKQVPFQNWLRSELEGLDPVTFSHLMSTRDLLRPGVFTHVSLQAWMQKRMAAARYSVRRKIKTASLPKSAIANNIRGLRHLIQRLDVKDHDSTWVDYTQTHSYSDASMQQKEDFVRQAAASQRPHLAWDLGCNIGNFTRIAGEYAEYVVAMDADHLSIERLYQNLKREGSRNVLPLVMNLTNISPNQGWGNCERQSLPARGKPDLTLCLALVHHMAISANVPISSFIAWLAGLGTSLVIEFVSKEDPMVKQLLLNKVDTYDDYNRPFFERCLNKSFQVQKSLELTGGTRYLYYATPLINS
jgi:ribosomal protein L11 methylase PrmA